MKVENVGVKGRGKGGGGTKMFRARMYRWEYFFGRGDLLLCTNYFFVIFLLLCRGVSYLMYMVFVGPVGLLFCIFFFV